MCLSLRMEGHLISPRLIPLTVHPETSVRIPIPGSRQTGTANPSSVAWILAGAYKEKCNEALRSDDDKLNDIDQQSQQSTHTLFSAHLELRQTLSKSEGGACSTGERVKE